MEIVKTGVAGMELPTLFGVLSDKSENGMVGFVIDPFDGTAIVRVNCDESMQAQFVLGFDFPVEDTVEDVDYVPEDDEIAYRAEVGKLLSAQFPDGYQMEWVGLWRDDPRTVKLCGWLDGTKPQLDDLFDYEVPDRVIQSNVENARKSNYTPNPQFWGADKGKSFYVGYVSALRVVTGLIQNSKNQKEILERVNKLQLDAMIMAGQNSSGIILG